MEDIFSRGAKIGPEEIERFVKMVMENWSEFNSVNKRERLELLVKLLTRFENMITTIEKSFENFKITDILIEILKQSPDEGDSKGGRSSFLNLQRKALHVCAAYTRVSESISKGLSKSDAIQVLTSLMGKDNSYWGLEEKEFLEIQRDCVGALINMCRKESDIQAFREPRVRWILQKYLETNDQITRIAAVSTLIEVYAPARSHVANHEKGDPMLYILPNNSRDADGKKVPVALEARDCSQHSSLVQEGSETTKSEKDKPVISDDHGEIDLLLIGKTGNGKSATGNTILGRDYFDSKGSMSSVTQDVQYEFTEYEGRSVTVVDGPGVGDTGYQDLEKATKFVIAAMQDAVLLNPKGYHAFLLVVRYGGRFTEEDSDVIKMLKAIFGQDFVKNFCILIMACGDNFAKEEVEKNGNTFVGWCREQTGIFQQLLQECEYRAILFDNRTKDEKVINDQIKMLMDTVDELKSGGERYTDANFQSVQRSRDNLLLTFKEPVIRQETFRQISLIIHEFERLSSRDAGNKLERLDSLIVKTEGLQKEIRQEDQGTGILEESLSSVKQLARALENKVMFEIKMNEIHSKMARREAELKERYEKETRDYVEQLKSRYETLGFEDQQRPEGETNHGEGAKPEWENVTAAEYRAIQIQVESNLRSEITETEERSAEILKTVNKGRLEEAAVLKNNMQNYYKIKENYDHVVKEHLKKKIKGEKTCPIL